MRLKGFEMLQGKLLLQTEDLILLGVLLSVLLGVVPGVPDTGPVAALAGAPVLHADPGEVEPGLTLAVAPPVVSDGGCGGAGDSSVKFYC